MLIWRSAGWRVESDGYVSGDNLVRLQELDALRREIHQYVLQETRRLAERARRTRRRAFVRGLRAGQAAALRGLVVPAAATAYALGRLQDRLLQLAMQAVTDLVGELPSGATLPNQLRSSLLAAPEQRLLSVRVAVSDFAEARHAVDLLEQELGLAFVTVLADADLPPRSCVVETEGGVIDGGLHRQLEALERGMRQAIGAVLDEYTRLDERVVARFDDIGCDLRAALDALSHGGPSA
ncbi:FliH/SctL family protein [Caballeronia sp. LZ065]|uniref:FliH/SctL family protein n=1 Tax=Caballeronia sp. LZ065 TaxID=3038571 RepID=UPI00285868EB|nr:FliH/SctL family protein [Caballeronia sp. LZ065]MDR5782059.1 FliH/SctL family protein [Caballeronia sp. LZ065]